MFPRNYTYKRELGVLVELPPLKFFTIRYLCLSSLVINTLYVGIV